MYSHVELTADGRLYAHPYDTEFPPIEAESFTSVMNTHIVVADGTTVETAITAIAKELELAEMVFEQSLNGVTINELYDDLQLADNDDDEAIIESGIKPVGLELSKYYHVYSKYLQPFRITEVLIEPLDIEEEVKATPDWVSNRVSVSMTPLHLIKNLPISISNESDINEYKVNSEGIITKEYSSLARSYSTTFTLYEFYSTLLSDLTQNGNTENKLRFKETLTSISIKLEKMVSDIINLTVDEAILLSESRDQSVIYVIVSEDGVQTDVPELSTEEIIDSDAIVYVELEGGKIVSYATSISG